MLSLRDAYFPPATSNAVEFRAFTHGLMPKTVPAMMDHFVSDWHMYGVDAWNEVPNHWKPGSGDKVGWWALPTYLGDQFIAPLLGAPTGTCIMQPNAHWIVQCLISSKEIFASKRKVILTEAEFPSVRFSLAQWSEVYNLEIITLPLYNSVIHEEALLEAIDEDTALVIISHVGFTTGQLLTDIFIKNVADRVHAVNGLLAVDGYHSIGSTSTSVEALNVDVYFGGLLKEGSGSSGSAFLYTRKDLPLTPRLTGWFGDADPFGFNAGPKKHPDTRNRFLGGTTAVASLYHAVEGVRILLGAGLKSVRADSLNKTSHCIQQIDKAGLKLQSPRNEECRSAMIILELPRADLMAHYLKNHQIFVDSRLGKYLRIAPFVWNTTAEIDGAFEIIKKGLTKNRYMNVAIRETAGPAT